MPRAKAPSTPSSEGKVDILTDDIHYFSPNFAAFASLREIFRVSVAA